MTCSKWQFDRVASVWYICILQTKTEVCVYAWKGMSVAKSTKRKPVPLPFILLFLEMNIFNIYEAESQVIASKSLFEGF